MLRKQSKRVGSVGQGCEQADLQSLFIVAHRVKAHPCGEALGARQAAEVYTLLPERLDMRKKSSNNHYELYERQAILCKAFANPTRLRLIDMLTKGERWAGELQEGLGISKANLSQHVAILKAAGLVTTRRQGKQLLCGISMPEVKQAAAIFRNMLKSQIRENRHWS